MSSDIIILQINTAFNEASISISKNGLLVHEIINANQQEHAGFIQPAIKEICTQMNISLNELSAVAVMNGPGSYTGLRVGLSSAKGICFTLNLPLICINTLDWIAFGNQTTETENNHSTTRFSFQFVWVVCTFQFQTVSVRTKQRT